MLWYYGNVPPTYPTNINDFLTPLTPTIGNSRRHSLQYTIPHCNTKAHQKSFFIATAKDWNALPIGSPLLHIPQWLARFLAIGKPPKPVDDPNDLSTKVSPYCQDLQLWSWRSSSKYGVQSISMLKTKFKNKALFWFADQWSISRTFFFLQQREQINKDTRLKMLLDVSYYARTCHVFEYSVLHVLIGHVWIASVSRVIIKFTYLGVAL